MDVVKGVAAEGPVVCAVFYLTGQGQVLVMGTQTNVGQPTCNLKLGGTHVGWIGEMSVPITSAAGNSSAKSLPCFQVSSAW